MCTTASKMGGPYAEGFSDDELIVGTDICADQEYTFEIFNGASSYRLDLNDEFLKGGTQGEYFRFSSDVTFTFTVPGAPAIIILGEWSPFCADWLDGVEDGYSNSLLDAKNQYLQGTLTTTTNPTSIEYWDVSCVTNMAELFESAETFNADIGGWDASSVTDMERMFKQAYDFNVDIGGWDVSSVTGMRYMFYRSETFNADIGGWDVSSVTDMRDMFYSAKTFNADIGGWDVSSVTDMAIMINNANVFNVDIGGWNVSSVTDMSGMFKYAHAFNVDICGWDVSSVNDGIHGIHHDDHDDYDNDGDDDWTNDIGYFTSCSEINDACEDDSEWIKNGKPDNADCAWMAKNVEYCSRAEDKNEVKAEDACECACPPGGTACPPGTTNGKHICLTCAHDIKTCLDKFPKALTCSDKDGGIVVDSDSVDCVLCMDSTGDAVDLGNDDCEWSLRGV